MSESNVPETIKYLTEDNLKLMYSRLNRRYLVVDVLPSVDSLEPADRNVIYVVKETVGGTVRYWPNVLDNDAWKPFGIDREDLDGKADKVSGATDGNFAGLDTNGNLADSGFKASDFKPKQTAVTDPTASGSGIEFIDSISQDTNGVIVPAKKSVQVAVASTSGVGGNAGVMSAADKEKLDGIEAGAQANAIEKVKAADIDLDIDDKTVNIPAMTGASAQGGGASGLVPAPTAGDQAKFLKGDGTWDTVADSPLFMATYTATTGNAMKAAIQSGKAVMCNARGYAPSQFGLLGKCDLNNNKYQFLYIYKNTNAYAQQLGDIAFRMVFCNHSGSSSWFGQIAQLTFKAPTAAGQVMKSASNGSGEFDWTLSTVSEVPTSAVGDAGKVLAVNSSGTAEWLLPSNMTGATASTDGASGLVPAPLAEEKDKFLKGDGTWATPPEANLANYYYDDRGNGLSAKRTGYDSPYGTTSLVGGQGNMNAYTISATFFIDWGGIARNFFSVNTYDPGASRIGFGKNSTDASAMRYLLPAPVANKYAKTDANGHITWGDVPSLPSPTINDSLLLGQADGSETWTALENDVFGTDQLWTGFAGKGFGAARAYADQDGNNIKATYATKEDLNTALGDIESLLAAL